MSISSALDQDSPWPRARSTYRVIKTRAMIVVMVMALCALILVTSYLGALSLLVRDRDSSKPIRIMVDTDVDADDVFALFYLLKQKQSQFDFQAITINANGWSDAGHAINYVYDILHMMDRDDIPVGVGGEGGILPNGTIVSDVGGYFPLIDQGMSTAGGCRYRQAIPLGAGGRLDVNSNYGLRKEFLPQGNRQYVPLQQPTAQEVMRNVVSAGPITVLLMGAQTNFAIFLMNNPHLKKNVEHIYVMGGAVRPICSKNTTKPEDCGPRGNLYPQDSNPYAEFNIFSDPLAAYMVLHSGIPVTLVPLDATKTVPVSTNFFSEFERRHDTYEAEYCFRSLNSIRASWPNNNFHEEYCMWDSFMAGVAVSMMRNSKGQSDGENEFAEIEYMNITVVTSNQPYGVPDDSNPLASGLRIPDVWKNRLHRGHVQTGMQDAFCTTKGKGPCQDGCTKEATGPDAVQVLVATRAKPSHSNGSSLDKEFYKSFLDVLNQPEQTGRHNLRTQSSSDKKVPYKPIVHTKWVGKPVVFDMDMSAGDFLALLYLLKLPAESINLKGILVSSTGWATPATVDVVYDILHMMGRDDIPVGLGDEFAVGQSDPIFPAIGDCKYAKAVPHGSGGFLDSDTLYGLARALPSGPRRYTAENSGRPELRQPSALDVWKSVVKSLDSGSKITILANGPLTNLAKIINSDHNSRSVIQEVFVVGGHLNDSNEKGNLFTVPSNQYAEFNMYLDPLAAKAAFDSELDLKILPLNMQRRVSSFGIMLDNLQSAYQTPEASFARLLLSRLWKLQREHHSYHHVDNFLGEVLGAVILSGNPKLNQTFNLKHLKVLADGGDLSSIGQTVIDENQGKAVKVLENFNAVVYYGSFAEVLGEQKQSAVRKSGESPGKF